MALLLTGCGGDGTGGEGTGGGGAPADNAPADNGVAAKSPDQILADARNAFKAAQSVHLRGNMKDEGTLVTIDMRMGQQAAQGTLRSGPTQFEFISVGGRFYLRGQQFLTQVGGPQLGQRAGNRWVSMPTSSQQSVASSVVGITDRNRFADEVLKPTGGLSKGQQTTIGTQKAIGLNDTEGVLYVATTGTPYPLRMVPKNQSQNEIFEFLEYNAPVNVSPPAGAVDLAQLGAPG